jgi:hypothetical protein
MSLYHIAQAIESSPVGQTIRESTWLFPAIEVVHLLALAVMGGAVLMTALSVFGVGLKSPPKEVEVTTRPFMTYSVIGLLVTGLLLGASEPVKLIDREAFLIKMTSLVLALLFTYFVFNPIVRKGDTGVPARAAAGVVMALWFTVALSGRWIGFS